MGKPKSEENFACKLLEPLKLVKVRVKDKVRSLVSVKVNVIVRSLVVVNVIVEI